MSKLKLTSSVHAAEYTTPDQFKLLHKREDAGVEMSAERCHYLIVDRRARGEHKRGLYTGYVVLGDQIAEAMDGLYFPGGVSVNFMEQLNGDWLVALHPQDIIGGAYAKLKAEDMEKLLAEFEKEC